MVKDDVDKENLVFQYTDNSKEVSVNLMIVHIKGPLQLHILFSLSYKCVAANFTLIKTRLSPVSLKIRAN